MAEEAKKRDVIVIESRMKQARIERNEWVVNAEHGTTVADVLKPQYWAHVAMKLRPFDHVEVRAEGGEWLLELIVLGCDRNWAKVQVKHAYDLGTVDAEMPKEAQHRVEWKGPQRKWSVIRNADNEVIFEGMDKAEAHAKLASHEKAMSV